jgi:EAL domain-containing protein (putative c-di-GMP-specific phosphodiesterase class I)
MSGLVKDLAEQLERQESETTEREARIERIMAAIAGTGRTTVFQPIVELDARAVIGFESLARFESDGEPWAVDRWFAEATDVGLATELELACIDTALAAFGSLGPDVYLSVNASHRTAESAAMLEALTGVDAARIVVEITEHEPVEDYDRLTTALAPARELGARIAIDDAGAGFASLRHILLIDPHIIKLDVSLTRGVDTDPKRRALAAALTSFAEEMGIAVVAEGIETPQELEVLRSLGVRYGQGFYLGRPAPLER